MTPQKYIKRAVEVMAIELTQYGDFVRAMKWVHDNGGSARCATEAKMGEPLVDYLIIETDTGNSEARVGDFIVRDVEGGFYPCKGSVFRSTHDLVQQPLVEPPLTLGEYIVGQAEARKKLVGGAALALPVVEDDD